MPVDETQTIKGTSHPTWHMKWTIGEVWDQHLQIWFSWILAGGRLFQQFSADQSAEQSNGTPCNKHLDDDGVSCAWHSSMCIHASRETIHIHWVLRVCKVLFVQGTSLNNKIPTVKWFTELMVKVMKKILSKADQGKEDMHLAMLAYWAREAQSRWSNDPS